MDPSKLRDRSSEQEANKSIIFEVRQRVKLVGPRGHLKIGSLGDVIEVSPEVPPKIVYVEFDNYKGVLQEFALLDGELGLVK